VWHKAVVNVGRRPTFDGEGITVETHLFDFDDDLYGKILRVAFVEFIRPEMKFDGFEAIKAQIAADCVVAREILDAAARDDITTPRQIAEAGNER
jgi:riboflavin kinase/FMN adenylyltransferase